MIIPHPSSLLLNLVDNRDSIDNFLRTLPSLFSSTRDVDTCTGNALHFAAKLIQDCGGMLCLVQSSLPSMGPAKLKPREVSSMLGSDSEKDLLVPAGTFFPEISRELVAKQISVHCFLGATSPCDVSSIGSLCSGTGGQLFYYPSFHVSTRWREVMCGDVHHVLSRETGFEAMYRVRVPSGSRVASFHGSFCLSNTDLMVSPVWHADETVTLGIEIENTLHLPAFPIQGALLYTNCKGERRIRVHTVMIPISNILSHIFLRVHQDVIAALLLQDGMFWRRR